MADHRRYDEDEVLRIFDEASRMQDEGGQTPTSGMTLDELRRIGAEVGIHPDRVERAARALDVRKHPEGSPIPGLPLTVGRTVDLGRRLTEEEWERVVLDLRETFDARGSVGGSGSFRHWRNGNLHALLEPVGDGHRLRLRTMKGSARGLLTAGAILVLIALAFGVAGLFGAGDAGSAIRLGVIGGALAAGGAIQLPSWAAQRERQMEEVARRALLLTREEADGGSDEGPGGGSREAPAP